MRKIEEKAPPGWKGTVAAMKKHSELTSKVNPYALAWSEKKKGYHPHYKNKKGSPEKMESFKSWLERMESQPNS